MNIKNLNIKLIDLRMYNDQQLSVISEQVNIADGCFQKMKKEGVVKFWFDNDACVDIACMYKEDLGETYSGVYKGIVVIDGIDPLSKKEKDNLLKMKPTVFNTKKIKTTSDSKVIDKVVETKNDTFDVDSLIKEKQLLDSKISKLLKQMESELILCVENENFEKAAILRDKINKLK